MWELAGDLSGVALTLCSTSVSVPDRRLPGAFFDRGPIARRPAFFERIGDRAEAGLNGEDQKPTIRRFSKLGQAAPQGAFPAGRHLLSVQNLRKLRALHGLRTD